MKLKPDTMEPLIGVGVVLGSIVVFVIICLLLTSCATPTATKPKPETARVTLYHAGEDRYGSRVAMSSKARAKYGRTVAARKCCFPFGTRLYFPDLVGVIDDGIFTVEDRGRDVETLKASHGKLEVVDIWSGTRRNYHRLAKKIPACLPFYRL